MKPGTGPPAPGDDGLNTRFQFDRIVVEAAWPTLGREAAGYHDFVRLRALEARLRGCEPEELPFDRDAWQAARVHEAALSAHRRRVRESTYVPAPSAMFRVH